MVNDVLKQMALDLVEKYSTELNLQSENPELENSLEKLENLWKILNKFWNVSIFIPNTLSRFHII